MGSKFHADNNIAEHNLIRLRTEVKLDLDDWTCVKHQFMLGGDYKPSIYCKYLGHPKHSYEKGSKVSWHLYNFVKSVDRNFILGSLICVQCAKKLNEMKCDEYNNADPDFVPTHTERL